MLEVILGLLWVFGSAVTVTTAASSYPVDGFIKLFIDSCLGNEENSCDQVQSYLSSQFKTNSAKLRYLVRGHPRNTVSQRRVWPAKLQASRPKSPCKGTGEEDAFAANGQTRAQLDKVLLPVLRHGKRVKSRKEASWPCLVWWSSHVLLAVWVLAWR